MQEIILNNFRLDSVNLIFVFTGILLTILTSLSALNYFQKKQKWYQVLTLVYILSFTMLILTENWFIFMTAWELVTLVTAIMLIWENKRIARQYFLIQFIGSSFLLYVILLAISKGYAQIGPISEPWLQNMFIFGLGMKSAIFGLHFWLPPIHSRAPSPVSAILSGWVVKLGFITYLKIIVDGNDLLIYLGFFMIFYGGIKALLSTDFKVLLAYSTISQLGFIALGIGSGSYYGLVGAIFHIIAHGLAKTGLFIGSAYWEKEYSTRVIYKFKSALQKHRFNSICTIIYFTSLMGFPLLAGYNSKYLIKHGFEGNFMISFLLHGASILTILYATRFFRWGIFGSIKSIKNISLNQKSIIKNYKLGITEKLSLLPSTLLLLIFGIFPFLIISFISKSASNYQLFTGFNIIIVDFLIAGILLINFNWFYVEEKEEPSLDRLFKKSYNLIYSLSVKSRSFDTDVLFENILYQILYKSSRGLYKFLFISFQNQLLWIPVFLILSLLWISYIM